MRVAPSLVITRQPGIGKRPFIHVRNVQLISQAGKGKTVWIYYALRQRLSGGDPVIGYCNQRRHLFVGAGVFECPKDFPSSYFKPFICTLVDSDAARDGVPDFLVDEGTRHFVIFTTSSRHKRWSRLHKTTESTVAIMNPWTKKEIFQA